MAESSDLAPHCPGVLRPSSCECWRLGWLSDGLLGLGEDVRCRSRRCGVAWVHRKPAGEAFHRSGWTGPGGVMKGQETGRPVSCHTVTAVQPRIDVSTLDTPGDPVGGNTNSEGVSGRPPDTDAIRSVEIGPNNRGGQVDRGPTTVCVLRPPWRIHGSAKHPGLATSRSAKRCLCPCTQGEGLRWQRRR